MKKADIDQIFNSAPDIPMKDAWTPLPKDAKGSKYSGDTIRVTGTPEFIKSVLDALDIATLKDGGMGIRTTILPAKSTTINGKPKDFQDLLGGRDAFACYLQRWENGSGSNRLTSMGVAAEMVVDTSMPPDPTAANKLIDLILTPSPKLRPSTRNSTSKKAKLTAIKNANVTYDRAPETSEILVPTGAEITEDEVARHNVNQLSIDLQSLSDPVDLLEMIDSIEEDLIESMGNEVEDLL